MSNDFKKALPVLEKGTATQMNHSLSFCCDGEFVGNGLARCAYGFASHGIYRLKVLGPVAE